MGRRKGSRNKKGKKRRDGGGSSELSRSATFEQEGTEVVAVEESISVLNRVEEVENVGENCGDDCPVFGDDDAEDAGDDEAEIAHGGVEEEGCRDLAMYFGEDARKDDVEFEEDSGDDFYDDEKIPDPLSSDDKNEEHARPGRAYRENADPEELLALGKTYSSAEDFKHALLRYTLKSRFNIKLYMSSALRLGAKCAAKDTICPWRVYCSYEKRIQKLMIKVFVNKHACEISGYSEYLKRSTITMLFSERLRLNPKMTKYEMAAEIKREYKMDVSDDSCGKAKTKLMKERKASHEEHFSRIWDYQAEVFRNNPGTTFDIETIPGPSIGSKQRFYRLYICFNAQKESWKKTCRPIIGLDGAFLKWDIKGQLLAAIGRDGDNRIVLIAWAVVEIENDTNWDWFVRHLTSDLGLHDGRNYTILSDKQKGLVKAVHTVLPQAEHRQCCRHIHENWKKGSHDLRLQKLFWYIAKSYTSGNYKLWMDELKKYNVGAHASLVVTKPETWARAFFRIGSLCNDNLNNLCESFNRTIRGARKKPLLDMLEDIRRQCMTRNAKREVLAKKMRSQFTKRTHEELDRVEFMSKECIRFTAVGTKTEVEHKGVAYSVDMDGLTCGCRKWKMTGIPCIHAANVIIAKKRKLSEFVAPCYTTDVWRQTYSVGIQPVQGKILWPETNILGVLPPPWRNGNPGRPKNHDRFKSMNEATSSNKDKDKLSRALRVVTCSNYKQDGHNKKTCKNEAVESAPKKPRGRPRKNHASQGEAQASTSHAEGSEFHVAQPQGSERWDQAAHAQASHVPRSQAPRSQAQGWAQWFE